MIRMSKLKIKMIRKKIRKINQRNRVLMRPNTNKNLVMYKDKKYVNIMKYINIIFNYRSYSIY